MDGAPYKTAKERGGCSFNCFRIQPRKSANVMFTAGLEALEANKWAQNNIQLNYQQL